MCRQGNCLSPILFRSEFSRFLLVGVINTAFGYGCYAMFIFFGIHYSIAILLATVLGVLFNFKTTGILVFKSSKNSLILRFVFVYIVVYFVNVFGVGILLKIGCTAYLGGGIMLFPAALLTFFLQKRFVFSHD